MILEISMTNCQARFYSKFEWIKYNCFHEFKYMRPLYITLYMWPTELDYFRICYHISNTTGATCGAGSAYPSGAPEIIPSFLWGSCCLLFSFLCCVMCTVVCRFVFKFLAKVLSVYFRPSFRGLRWYWKYRWQIVRQEFIQSLNEASTIVFMNLNTW